MSEETPRAIRVRAFANDITDRFDIIEAESFHLKTIIFSALAGTAAGLLAGYAIPEYAKNTLIGKGYMLTSPNTTPALDKEVFVHVYSQLPEAPKQIDEVSCSSDIRSTRDSSPFSNPSFYGREVIEVPSTAPLWDHSLASMYNYKQVVSSTSTVLGITLGIVCGALYARYKNRKRHSASH